MRAFIAIDLEPGLKTALEGLIRVLKRTGADIRWSRAGAMHLTLKFLGDIDEGQAASVHKALEAVAVRHTPFPLRLEGTGAFPGAERPRVLWAGFGDEPKLAALQTDIECELESEGIAREERPFHPHLTLGRVKGPGRVREAMKELESRHEDARGSMTVRRIALFESRLKPEGAEYRVVAGYELS